MFTRKLLLVVGVVAALSGCASREAVPVVQVLPNSSGLLIAATREHGPEKDFYSIAGPSGTELVLKRLRPLQNEEPRYFTPAPRVLAVVSVEDPDRYDLTARLTTWKSFLDGDLSTREMQEKLYHSKLPEIPRMHAGRCFHAKLRIHKFPWGKAVLFLTHYVQGKTGGPVNSDMLILVVQGLTSDGKYAVNGRFEIRHPALPKSLWDEEKRGKAVFALNDEKDEAEKWLDNQADGSFQPTIQTYLAFLESLRIAPKK